MLAAARARSTSVAVPPAGSAEAGTVQSMVWPLGTAQVTPAVEAAVSSGVAANEKPDGKVSVTVASPTAALVPTFMTATV